MPEVICTTVYQFPELSDTAKEKARSWYRELGPHDDWWDAVYEDFERVCEILGIRLKTTPVRLMGGGTRPVSYPHLDVYQRQGNKDRLFDGFMAVGITHVTVTFDGAGASGQIESISAWSGATAVDFPATEIAYAALTWDDPEVEMRQLSLEDGVEQLAYDFLSDTHCGWENNDGAYGEFCFDAAARCIHLEFNERFTSSELHTHDF